MSIISLPRQHLKHHPDEAALLAPLAKQSAVAELLHRDEFPDLRAKFEAEHPAMPERFRPVPGGGRAPAVLAELRGQTLLEQTSHAVASAALDLDALVITTTVGMYTEVADELVLSLHELVALAEELDALAPLAGQLAEVAAL